MNRFLKRFLLIIGILLLLLVGAALAVSTLFEDAVGQRIVKGINSQIATELRVEDFNLTLFRSFPSAAIVLKGVELQGANRDLLLDAGEVSFRIGYASIFGGAIQVNSVLISNGALRIHVDPQGKANYDIWKESGEDKTGGGSGDTKLSLKTARLEHVFLNYRNEPQLQHISANVESLDLSGEFSAKAFDMKMVAAIQSNFVDLSDIRYFPDKKIGVDALLAVDLENGSYDFRKFDLQVEKNLFQLDGTVTVRDDGTAFNLFVANKEGHLDDLILLLPQQSLERVGKLSSSGDFFFDGRVEGLQSERTSPDIHFKFGLKGGKLESELLPSGLRDVSFEARFTNGKGRSNETTEFEIKKFEGLFGRNPVDFSLLVRNLDDPQIDFLLDGVVPIETVARLVGSAGLKDGSGEVEIQQLSLRGRYSDMIDPAKMTNVQLAGRIEFDDASLDFEKEKLTFDRGLLEIKGNDLTLKDLKLEGAGSDIVLNGSCSNLLPVLLADSLHSDTKLVFNASWRSDMLDIDRFLSIVSAPAAEEGAAQATDSIMGPPAPPEPSTGGWFATHLDGIFDCQIKQFNYGKVEGAYFMGKLIFDGNTLLIEGSAEAMGGRFNLNGGLFFEDRLRLQARLDCAQVDVKEFFRQTDNFGQTMLTDRNLSGALNTKMALFINFDEQGNLLLDELIVFAGIGIENGELKDFELLNNLSSFVKVEDLRKIKFANIQNWLEIKNGKLYIPSMFIQSNALNLTVSGEQSFAGQIDYNIKVNAGQVLANKFKQHNPGLEPIKAKSGLVNLYFKIFGTIDSFDYKTAKKTVKQDFAKSEARKAEIKKALLQAFGDVDLIEEPGAWADTGEAAVLEGF
ncbi:MAG: hypothetical protein IPG32_00640 [Saprospirales bacterium]|nr:hypothetical protein [Saprospirales bacterium]